MKRILVVDDQPDLVRLAQRRLERAGYAVRTGADGEEAIRLVAEEPPDLLIIDLMMPKKDGFEAVREIRRLGYSDLPIVMLTARSAERDVLSGYEEGVDYYLTKPFKYDRLLDIVRYLLGDLSDEERAEVEKRL